MRIVLVEPDPFRLVAVIIHADRQVIGEAVPVISKPLSFSRSDAEEVFNARAAGVIHGDKSTAAYVAQALGSRVIEGAP